MLSHQTIQQIEDNLKLYKIMSEDKSLPDIMRKANAQMYEEAKARKIYEAKVKAEMEESAKRVGEAAAREAAESAAKAAAYVLAEESINREKAILSEQKQEINELKQMMLEQQKTIAAQHAALEQQNMAAKVAELSQINQSLVNVIQTISNPLDNILIKAAAEGDLDKAQSAIKLGADINCHDDHGNTPLHLACQANQKNMIDYLLKACADKSIKNLDKKTAMELASNPDINTLLTPAAKSEVSSKAPMPQFISMFANVIKHSHDTAKTVINNANNQPRRQ